MWQDKLTFHFNHHIPQGLLKIIQGRSGAVEGVCLINSPPISASERAYKLIQSLGIFSYIFVLYKHLRKKRKTLAIFEPT